MTHLLTLLRGELSTFDFQPMARAVFGNVLRSYYNLKDFLFLLFKLVFHFKL